METGLVKFLEALVEGYERLVPWSIVNEGQGGVVLRLGRYSRTLHTGFNWKLPLIEVSVTISTALDVIILGPQSLTARDGSAFVVMGVLKYRVRDPKPLCCAIEDEISALGDVSEGAVKRALVTRTWEEIVSSNGEAEREILVAIRNEVNEWGFKVYSVTLTNLSPMKSLRLLQDQQVISNVEA